MKNFLQKITSEQASRIILILLFLASLIVASEWKVGEEYQNPYSIVKIVSYLYDEKHQSLRNIGYGSGVVINQKNQILTNFHVVSDEDTTRPADIFEVCYSEDLRQVPDCLYSATLVSYEEDHDAALLQLVEGEVPFPTFPKLPISNKKPLISENIKVVGFPDIGYETLTVTSGTISGFSKDNRGNWTKFDSKTSYGGSGGALLNEKGELIGIATMVNSSDLDSLGYFKPIDEIDDFISENENRLPSINQKALEEIRRKIGLESFDSGENEYHHDNPEFEISLGDKWLIKWIGRVDDNSLELKHKYEPITIGMNFFEFNQVPAFEDFKKEVANYMDESSLVYSFSSDDEYEFAGSSNYGKGVVRIIGNFGADIYWYSDINIQSSSSRVEEWHKDFLDLVSSIKAESSEQIVINTFDHQASGMRFPIQFPWYARLYEMNRNSVVLYRSGNSSLKISIYHNDLNEKSLINTDQFFDNQVTNLSQDLDDFSLIEKRKIRIYGLNAYRAVYSYRSGRREVVEKLDRIYMDGENAQEISTYVRSTKDNQKVDFAISEEFMRSISINSQ